MKAARREGGAAAAAATCRLENSRLPHGKRKNKRFPAAVDVDRGPLALEDSKVGFCVDTLFLSLLFSTVFWLNLVVVVVVSSTFFKQFLEGTWPRGA